MKKHRKDCGHSTIMNMVELWFACYITLFIRYWFPFGVVCVGSEPTCLGNQVRIHYTNVSIYTYATNFAQRLKFVSHLYYYQIFFRFDSVGCLDESFNPE